MLGRGRGGGVRLQSQFSHSTSMHFVGAVSSSTAAEGLGDGRGPEAHIESVSRYVKCPLPG